MEKLKMHSVNKVDENIAKIGKLFPNCVTERKNENGEVEYAVDFDMLRQELSSVVVEGNEERYQFTWPDKKKAVLAANAPISATLRPCREESVDFDTTQNLYIEGDNLDVLKLLQETYLGKIRIIYLDPPYNTGNDFVYNDDFSVRTEDYFANSGQYDGEGNRLVQNTESNGRFHTDWINMIYPRLKLARDLLTEDGAIFVSIDDNEVEHLTAVMNEIFGEENHVETIVWDKKSSAKGVPPKSMMVNVHEYIVVFQKSDGFSFSGEKRDEKNDGFKNPDNDPRGPWRESNIKSTTKPLEEAFTIVNPDTGRKYTNTWAFSKESLEKMIAEKRILWKESLPKQKEFLREMTNENKAIKSTFGVFDPQSTTVFLKKLLPQVKFDNPKPISLMKYLLNVASRKDDIIFDCFSGSSTTAQAVLELNAEDGGHRKFIMVQLPEATDPKSEAYKAGYKNICEIGKERIRRAGKKIKEDNPLTTQDLDIGFRVLKLDSSNMKDVYYTSDAYTRDMFDILADNIKEDRTPEDLLFQVMLDLGIPLSSKIEESVIAGKKVFKVEDNYLIACFDSNLTEETITAIAQQRPYYYVMRDSSMANDSVATNFEQIFATYSPDTDRKVL